VKTFANRVCTICWGFGLSLTAVGVVLDRVSFPVRSSKGRFITPGNQAMVRYWISIIKLGLLLGAFSLQESSSALGQACCQGFHIPSLQTLVMMPLSNAGDRFEAKWLRVHAGCDTNAPQSSDIPRLAIECDTWTQPPSYKLDDQSMSAPKEPEIFKSASSDSDEVLASKWNAPVKVGALKTTSQTPLTLGLKNETLGNQASRQALESIATADSNVRLASGTIDTQTVRVTAVSQSTHWMSEARKAGEIKEKHLQRKRPESSSSSKK